MSEMMDPSKLKVAELRAELQDRGLDTKGNKAVLVDRLTEALEQDTEGGAGVYQKDKDTESGAHDNDEDEDEDEDQDDEEQEEKPLDEPEQEEEQEKEDLDYEENQEIENEQEQEEEIEQEQEPEAEPEAEAEAEPEQESEDVSEQEANVKEEPCDDDQANDGPGEKDGFEEQSKEGYEDAPMEQDDIKQEQDNGEVQEKEVKQEPVEVKRERDDRDSRGSRDRHGEKRRWSDNRDAPDVKRSRPDVEEVRVENEPQTDKTAVVLDWYNSDMSVKIDENYLSATPMTEHGFGYVWHGVKATFGYTQGRVYYEAKIEEEIPVPHLEADEQHPHVLRVGWSIDEAGMVLGEEKLSYGYGGTGKASVNLKFKDYGGPFGKGDILGCFLDMDSEPITVSYTINGQHKGICYEISRQELGDKALYPHIVTKNCSFKVNFGSEAPWNEPLTGYTFVADIPIEERVLGTQGPEKRSDGEIIMMIGLPASGKTTWVNKYCRDNPDKKYNVLGTNNLIDKMKVNGLPRKRNYAGRWEVLIERCTKCLNSLLQGSYKRRRNFIIDQVKYYSKKILVESSSGQLQRLACPVITNR